MCRNVRCVYTFNTFILSRVNEITSNPHYIIAAIGWILYQPLIRIISFYVPMRSDLLQLYAICLWMYMISLDNYPRHCMFSYSYPNREIRGNIFIDLYVYTFHIWSCFFWSILYMRTGMNKWHNFTGLQNNS